MNKLRRLIFVFITLVVLACQTESTPVPTVVPTDPRADEAHQIIFEVENMARAIQSGSDNSYYLAVEYAARDALLSFPDDPRAESWRWKMAYYATLAGDTQFGHKTYIELIDTALNSGEATIESLPAWFHPGELTEADGMIPFELKVEKIKTVEDEEKFLIKISSFPGGACFLTVKSSSQYSTTLIYDGFPENGFSVFYYDSLGCSMKDLTGDGNDEVILENYKGGHVGFSTVRVMDISVIPMQLLPFVSRGTEAVLEESGQALEDFPVLNGKNQIQTVNYAQDCQVSLEKTFDWSEDRFELLNVEFHADVEYAPLKRCLFRSVTYARWLDLEDGVKVIEQALQQYEPFAMDEQDREKLDRVRIEKALLYLFANRPEEMKAEFQEVLENSNLKNEIWEEPIREFLREYSAPSDIYRACNELTTCIQYDETQSCSQQSLCSHEAFEYLVEHEFKDKPLTNLISNLQDAGVNILSSGWLDLDHDGRDELWFVAAYPQKQGNAATYNLGIVTDYPSGIKMFSDLPGQQGESAEFKIEKTPDGQTFVKYSQPWGFLWSRDGITNEPALRIPVCGALECFILEQGSDGSFAALRHQLQMGVDPYQMYVAYMNLNKYYEANPDHKCVMCDFDLGYIAELVGDTKTAKAMYSKLVESFPDHPLAILAKSKLER